MEISWEIIFLILGIYLEKIFSEAQIYTLNSISVPEIIQFIYRIFRES